jgi:hypothetical protein
MLDGRNFKHIFTIFTIIITQEAATQSVVEPQCARQGFQKAASARQDAYNN